MPAHHMILAALALVGMAQAGLVPSAVGVAGIVAPYASTFNAHHINHAVAYPVAPAVLSAPSPVAATQHRVAFVAPPPPASYVGHTSAAVLPAPAPVAIAAPAKFGYPAAPIGYVSTPFAATPFTSSPFAVHTPAAGVPAPVAFTAPPAVKVGFAVPHSPLTLEHSRFVAPNYFI